jgi:arylsulfatase A-like enzyme
MTPVRYVSIFSIRAVRVSVGILVAVTCGTFPLSVAQAEKPNVLFIAIDDLRPELGCYGSPIAKTPVMDELASQGLLFNRAYCQQAICSPSRASLMTGARPDTIGVVENYTYFRDKNPDIVTLPQYFRSQGYETVNVGKVYHGKYNDPEKSWSRLPAWNRMPRDLPKPIGVGGYALEEN